MWMGTACRDLTNYQWRLVSNAISSCSLPIFVKLVFAEICRWRSYTKPQDTHLAATVMDSIMMLFERIEKQVNIIYSPRHGAYRPLSGRSRMLILKQNQGATLFKGGKTNFKKLQWLSWVAAWKDTGVPRPGLHHSSQVRSIWIGIGRSDFVGRPSPGRRVPVPHASCSTDTPALMDSDKEWFAELFKRERGRRSQCHELVSQVWLRRTP